ncbi:MAG: hypothetical protein IPP65_01640 [Chlorobi bacterium]|nr:hypothetical protein [Chlorobiota bacterium]
MKNLNKILFIILIQANVFHCFSKTNIYSFEFNSESNYNPSVLSQNSKVEINEKLNIIIKLSGNLSRNSIKNEDSTNLEIINFSDLNLIIINNNQNLSRFQTAEFLEQFSKPILLKKSLDNKIISISMDTVVTSTTNSIMLNIISNIQFRIGDSINKKYSEIEKEPTGEYVSEYIIKPTKIPGVINVKKYKLKFTKLYGDIETLGYTKINVKFNGEFFIDTNNLISKNINISERKTVFVNKKIIGDGTMTLKVNYLNSIENNESNIDKSSYTNWFEIDEDIYKQKRFINRNINILGDDNTNSILLKIDSIEQTGEKWDGKIFDKLLALLIVKPNSNNELLNIISLDTITDFKLKIILAALVNTNLESAQSTFINYIKLKRNDLKKMDNALPNLINLKKPNQEIVDLIDSMAFNSSIPEISKMAKLCLGIIANNLYNYDLKRGDELTKQLIKKVGDSDDDDNLYLQVLGNTGSSLVYDFIIPYIDIDYYRVVAIRSLRFIKLKVVDDLLKKLLKNNRNKIDIENIKSVIKFRKELKNY